MTLFPDRDAEEPPGEILENVQEEPPDLVPHSAPLIPKIPFTLVSKIFPIAEERYFFIRRYYPGVGPDLWNNWRWQFANRISEKKELRRIISISPAESEALEEAGIRLSLRITPYYASLLHSQNPEDPLRRTVIPRLEELLSSDLRAAHGEREGPREMGDPLNEEGQSVCPNLVHRYPDRVLFLATDVCSVNCRYCTRSRIVGGGKSSKGTEELLGTWDKKFLQGEEKRFALSYIRQHREIRDVLISGGDPLTLSDNVLEELLKELRSIPHVEMLRIGTKVPAVLPQRITGKLVAMLKKYHPLYISIHSTHPDECTPEMEEACRRLADGGIPLGSQTVLLKGINDNAEVLGRLFKKLLTFRVRPYYLYQCDPVAGAEHFRTPVERGIKILDALQGYMTGYGIPTFVVDAPGGGGKIPIFSQRLMGRDGDYLILKNFRGELYKYPDRESSNSDSKNGKRSLVES